MKTLRLKFGKSGYIQTLKARTYRPDAVAYRDIKLRGIWEDIERKLYFGETVTKEPQRNPK